LIFDPVSTTNKSGSIFPSHGASTPPAIIHFALEIEQEDYKDLKDTLIRNGIKIEKELIWGDDRLKSMYFRDPAGNLVEFITKGNWPVED
ncbi:MAG TPA: hypothetical protein VEH06_02845, partial [Candidatus Bathyarchaeia archaeon]|nr:hypothetical protein [Candidatus Bathyarchaeia archaeon]